MAKKRPTKRKAAPKRLTARSITLVDAKGKPRILLDPGNGDGYACICLYGEKDRSIQISTDPNGSLSIALLGPRFDASLGVSPDNDAGLCIRDRNGLLGTMLGSYLDPGKHQLVLFQDGQPVWSSAQPPKTRRRKTKPAAK